MILFIRKCRVKNLSQASIVSYENKIHPFVDYCEGGLSVRLQSTQWMDLPIILKQNIM